LTTAAIEVPGLRPGLERNRRDDARVLHTAARVEAAFAIS
jgi:hypothetical protein